MSRPWTPSVPYPTDATPLAPQPEFWNGRYHCRPEMPYDPEMHGERAYHPQATEIADYGDSRRMRCPVCGTSWEEELAQ